MDSGNRAFASDAGTSDTGEPIFSATLTPHRSLGRSGFVMLMGFVGVVWFAAGLFFWSVGAWPVGGFCGLDFVALWLAFHLNYRAARAYEAIDVTPRELTIRKVGPAGRAQEFRCNPRWARLEVLRAADEDVTRIAVRLRDERVIVGAFLNPADRRSLAEAFNAALATARR